MKTKTLTKKLEALREQAIKEQGAAEDVGSHALHWAWWAIVDALDAALSTMNVIERLSED
jgi:hypothetical protein